jgi:phosphoglucosamine mutase
VARQPKKKPGANRKPAGKTPRAKTAKQPVKKPANKAANKPSAKPAALFGTDGIRSEAGRGPLTPENVLAIGRALGRFLAEHAEKSVRPIVLLGVDPRPSADLVGTTLAAGLIAEHCDVHWPGMMSTPEVAFLTGHGNFAAGISVTASHNPADDNGIKIFGKDGRKLPEAIEKRIEQAVLGGKTAGPARHDGLRFGWLHLGRERHYENFIVKTFRKSFATLKKRPLAAVIDAAYGARSVDLQVLSQLAHSLAFGKTEPEFRVGSSMAAGGDAADNALDVYFLNAASPSHPETHFLINRNCGSLHPQGCARAVRELKADIGVCFDGDGDRCVLVDETGAIRDGDHMLALLAADMKARGVLKNDLVVSTTMANLGLERALNQIGVQLIRTDVGDKYVLEAMHKHGAVLGGEQSGHIILADEGHLAGDGLYTALRVIEVMLDTGKPLSELCGAVSKFPQTIVNVKTKAKPPIGSLKNLKKLTSSLETELGNRGRINVRYSGTEPLLRIMVEAEDQATLDQVAGALEAAAEKDLG